MRVFVIISLLSLIGLGSCSPKAKNEKAAEQQMRKTIAEKTIDPNIRIENIRNVFSNDSISILHFDLTGKNGFGNEITNKYEYVYLASGGNVYDGFLELTPDSVFQDRITWEKQKEGEIYEKLDYENSIIYRAIDLLNKQGRNIDDKFNEMEINIMPPTKTGKWHLHSASDKFGEKTNNKYLTLSGNGEFSNSATSHSDLYGIIFVGKDYVQLKMLEYNRLTVKDDSGYYKVNIKDKDGIEYPTMIFANDGNEGIIFPIDLTDKTYTQLLTILKKGGQINFHIKNDNYGVSTYQFKVQADGLEEALKYVQD